MILALTSFGFGLCGFIAGVKGHIIDSALNIAVSLCSTLHHSHGCDHSKYRGGQIVGRADEILAKIIVSKYCYDGIHMGLIGLPTVLSGICGTVVYYKKIAHVKEFYKKGQIPVWHLSMHLSAQFGILYKHLIS
jgi:hypothetical protein